MRLMTKKLNPNRKVTMTVKEINQLKKRTTNKALSIVNYFPMWVLRTKYGFGEKRIKEYMKHYHDLLEAYNEGYIDLVDIAKMLEKEVNIKL